MIKILIIIVLICLWILWRRRKYYILGFKMPGPWGYPLIGMSLALQKRKDFSNVFKQYEEIYNNCGLTWMGPWPFFIIAEPQFAQEILTSPHCVNRSKLIGDASEHIGYGLLTLNEPQWSQHRKLLNPAFSNKVLMSFFSIFNEESEKLLKTLKHYCGRGNIELSKILRLFTLTLTTKTMMDGNLSPKKADILIKCYNYMTEFIIESTISPWLKYAMFRKLLGKYSQCNEFKLKIDEFIENLIEQKLKSTKAPESQNPLTNDNKNFIKLALKLFEESKFTIKNVKSEAHVMVIAAYETSTNTLFHTLMLLAMFPDYQQKLFEEIINVYPDRENFEINADELKQMIYLDMVINEVMRVMTPIPIIFRKVSSDMKLSNGVTLPKGLQIGIDIFNMQRRTDIWGPDAHIFNPENFLPENRKGKHSYAFLPFAKGPRSCIGWRYSLLSMKVILMKLIRNFYFKTNFKFDELEFVQDVTIKLKTIPTIEICQRDN